jgi:hypothetical protein
MVAAAVGIGAAVAGTAVSASASKSAAKTQADAANNAAQVQWNEFNQLQQNQQPYMDLGVGTIPRLQDQLGNLGRMQFSFSPGDLTQTPGYQFTLQQGLKGVDNSLSAKGLNLSGAQAKGIGQYATGLADQTYQQQYQNALQQFMTNYGVQSDQYNRLSGLVGLGQNSAALVGNAGLQTANNVGNYITQAGNAQAAGTIGVGNAINKGLSSIGSFGLLGSGGLGGGGGGIYGLQ